MRQGRIWLWAYGGARSGKRDRAVITFSGISKWLGLYYSAVVWLNASKGSFQDSSVPNIKFSSVYNISYRFGGERSAALIKPIGNSALPQCVCAAQFLMIRKCDNTILRVWHTDSAWCSMIVIQPAVFNVQDSMKSTIVELYYTKITSDRQHNVFFFCFFFNSERLAQ